MPNTRFNDDDDEDLEDDLEGEPDEPEEGDLTTKDHIHFYQDGKRVLTLMNKDGDAYGNSYMWMKLREFMKKEQFWPNVWFISDHGNAHLMTRK